MKYLTGFLVLGALLTGCGKYREEVVKFPECVGIRDSFNPYHIVDPYLVTFRGPDTLAVRLIFTDYNESPITTDRWPKWNMWVVNASVPDTVRYYKGYCNKNYETDKWYGVSGIYLHGQYSSCYFDFEKFTCTEVSGTCLTISINQDSLDYIFTGTK